MRQFLGSGQDHVDDELVAVVIRATSNTSAMGFRMINLGLVS